MKVLLDIKDKNAAPLLEVLKSLPYVKTKELKDPKEELINDIKEAVEELNLIKAGKLEGRNAEDFLNEL